MDAKDKVIVALDVDTFEKARLLVEELIPYVNYFKVGLELISAGECQQTIKFIHNIGKKVFYDGKFNDTPKTIMRASRAVRKKGVEMFSVHCSSGTAGMVAAKESVNEAYPTDKTMPKILGVTILTSHNYNSLVEIGVFEELDVVNLQVLHKVMQQRTEDLVIKLALLAQDNGLDGVIASPLEIKAIRNCCQSEFLVVTPGVRPKWADVDTDDQKRVMTPSEAIEAGANYLVIGRPVTKPPSKIGLPANAIRIILDEINLVL